MFLNSLLSRLSSSAFYLFIGYIAGAFFSTAISFNFAETLWGNLWTYIWLLFWPIMMAIQFFIWFLALILLLAIAEGISRLIWKRSLFQRDIIIHRF